MSQQKRPRGRPRKQGKRLSPKKIESLLEAQYDQGKGNEDLTEVTEETQVQSILGKMVKKASTIFGEYTGSKKHVIITAAYDLEEHFKKTNGTQYICRISEIITHVLKEKLKGFITDPYMRRTLEERFKNPQWRSNALQRKRKTNDLGVPTHSGRTFEQMQAATSHISQAKNVDAMFEDLEGEVKWLCRMVELILDRGKEEELNKRELFKRVRDKLEPVFNIGDQDATAE